MDLQLTVFRTDLGWMGLLGAAGVARRLSIGHAAAAEVRERMAADCPEGWSETNWWPELRARLVAYASGEAEDFRDVPVPTEGLTPFGRGVVACLRTIGFGETISYGQLAERVGAPGAARAVGSVMARNTTPLIVPCHRVIGAGGKLGGFSAPQGLLLKRRLLDLEAGGRPRDGRVAAARPPRAAAALAR